MNVMEDLHSAVLSRNVFPLMYVYNITICLCSWVLLSVYC